MATKKLTPALLRKIVMEEKQRVLAEKAAQFVDEKPTEVDADEYADTLEKHEDFTVAEARKALHRIEMMERDEKALVKKLRQIREAKQRAIRSIGK
jgi:hypothetical protein